MSIEEDIVAWASQRPAWQQGVLVALADGELFDTEKIAALADDLVAGENMEANQDAKRISIKSSDPQQVQLVAVADVIGVNALVDGQSLTVAPTGITVVYGDNGSGKSGYARLIKHLVKARHVSQILPNVFGDGSATPSAAMRYSVAGIEATVNYSASAVSETLKMSFYDEHCGDEYLTKQSVISYRPSALVLLDGLIEVCDLAKAEIADRLTNNQINSLNLNIPPQTTAGAFVVGLTGGTTDAQTQIRE